MRNIIIAIFALLVLGSPAWSQACDSGVWTATRQQPASCLPYAENGVFSRPLPNAGNGGPLEFRIHNSAAIVYRLLTDQGRVPQSGWGRMTIASPGPSEWGTMPIYYGLATDPIYKVPASACLNDVRCGVPGSEFDVRDTYWHIPNRAKWSGLSETFGIADQFFLVWDQTNNKVLYSYRSGLTTTTGALPNCTATTIETACPIADIGWAQKTDYTRSRDYQIFNPGGNSLNSAGLALTVRHKEWLDRKIQQALYINTPCEADEVAFPALGSHHALLCSEGGRDTIPAARPKHGALFFLDYTDAQIDAMNLPAWQEPFIRALAHYGGYQGDTFGAGAITSLQITRIEGSQGFQAAGVQSLLYEWLESQGIPCFEGGPSESKCRYNVNILSDVPLMTGPDCPSEACGVEKHLHIANPCVARGFAGLTGCGEPVISPNGVIITTKP